MNIKDGRVGPKLEQHQVKVYPGTKLIPSRQKSIVATAGSSLARVMHAVGAQVTDVVLHIWYSGEPAGDVEPDLASHYRTAFNTWRFALGEQLPPGDTLPRVTVQLHQYDDVLAVLPSTLRTEVERAPVPWSV
jgi:hypothetical protein